MSAIKIFPNNKIWFKHPTTGKAIVLSGSSTWGNGLYDESSPYVDFDDYLDFLITNGHNFIRMWCTENCTLGNYYRYNTSGSDFDLTSLNANYLDNLRAKCIAAGDAGIFVGIMLFRPDDARDSGDTAANYFNSANNVNSINGDTNSDGHCYETYNNSITAITNIQKAYIDAVLAHITDLDNVIWEIGNEGDTGSVAWQELLIDYIHSVDTANPHLVIMSSVNDWTGDTYPDDTVLSAHADVWTRGDVSFATAPPANDYSFPVFSDTDHYLDFITTPLTWPWKTFLRGNHPILMDWYNYGDPPDYYTAAEQTAMRLHLGQIVASAHRVDLRYMHPASSLCETGYCLANVNSEYICLQDGTGAFDVYLTGTSGTFTATWLNPATGSYSSGGTVSGGATREVTPPGSGMYVLYLTKASSRVVEAAELTKGYGATDPATTASISPSANALVLLTVVLRADASPSTNSVTVTSNAGLNSSWTLIADTLMTAAGGQRRTLVWRSLSATPGAGTIGLNYVGAGNLISWVWSVVELTHVKTSGSNGADAITTIAINSNSADTDISPDVTITGSPAALDATLIILGNEDAQANGTEAGWDTICEEDRGADTQVKVSIDTEQDQVHVWSDQGNIDRSWAAVGMLIAGSAIIDLEDFRFRNDDNNEASATWKAAQGTNITLAADTAFRLRELLDAAGDPASINPQQDYRYKRSGGSFGHWRQVK